MCAIRYVFAYLFILNNDDHHLFVCVCALYFVYQDFDLFITGICVFFFPYSTLMYARNVIFSFLIICTECLRFKKRK